jgi:hypothetical protein
MSFFICQSNSLDCTHIKLQSPGGDHGDHTQVISDANLKFIDVVARWSGSVHDSTIFNDSRRFVDIRMRLDSGYACKRYLLTPLLIE